MLNEIPFDQRRMKKRFWNPSSLPKCNWALLYLAQCIKPNISFAVNLLARYSNASTRRHWNGVKDIFRYLKGTTDLGLFYTRESPSVAAPYGPQVDSRLVGNADAGYLSDPHRAHSQTGYVFTVGDTVIS